MLDDANATRTLDHVETAWLARRGDHLHRLPQPDSDDLEAKRAIGRGRARSNDRCHADGRYECLRATQISSAGHLCAHSVVA